MGFNVLMSRNVSTSVPTSVPTWKPHRKNYHNPRHVNHRGMIAWSITKPLELKKPNNKDKRLSSGTSNKRVAEKVKSEKATIIYQWFDQELEKLKPEKDEDAKNENLKQFLRITLQAWVT